mmetsp:Transcript_28880/g.94411  ORF Transcript_28880/g.94411 Transcript_28880/m.94411 type:complete len:239 (+) Transcript_28880:776-1492(+)
MRVWSFWERMRSATAWRSAKWRSFSAHFRSQSSVKTAQSMSTARSVAERCTAASRASPCMWSSCISFLSDLMLFRSAVAPRNSPSRSSDEASFESTGTICAINCRFSNTSSSPLPSVSYCIKSWSTPDTPRARKCSALNSVSSRRSSTLSPSRSTLPNACDNSWTKFVRAAKRAFASSVLSFAALLSLFNTSSVCFFVCFSSGVIPWPLKAAALKRDMLFSPSKTRSRQILSCSIYII